MKINNFMAIPKPLPYILFCLLLASVVLHSNQSVAQNIKRIELPLPPTSESYHSISLGQNGIILVNQTSRNSFSVQKFNTELERDWAVDGQIEDRLEFIQSSYDGQSVYLLFSRNRTEYYQVVKVNVSLGFLETFYLSSIDKFEITDFQTIGYSVFMAGTVRNEPILLYTNLQTKQSKVLPGVSQANAVIQSVTIDTVYRNVNVSYALRRNKDVKIIAKTFDEIGQVVNQVIIEPEPDYSLLSGRVFAFNDSTRLIIGTYGFRNMQGGSGGAVSQGMFLSKAIYDEVVFTQYHSFADFKNFFNFLSDKARERMDKRIEKKKESGSELKLNYRLLVHDIIQNGDNYLISAEVFYPEYRNNNTGPYGINSSMFMSPMALRGFYPGIWNPYLYNPFYNYNRYNNSQTFDGFVYTHAIVASFDQAGKLLWDNCLPFESLKSMELKEKVRVKPNEDQTVSMFYSNKGAIKAKIFNQNQTLADRTPINITTEDATDKVRQTSTDEVVFWYGNYYLATGYQRIAGQDGRRNVFYLNKIAF